jgi:twitching motility protein PilT
MDVGKFHPGACAGDGPGGQRKIHHPGLHHRRDQRHPQRPYHHLEDPIEYLHRHKKSVVTQREIVNDTQSYVAALRSALRQSPDVILLGEMRDYETISTAMTAAETGHLVISTLHTVGAAKTIDRIIDVFPPGQQPQIRDQIAMVLQAVISMQLLPCAGGGMTPVFEIMFSNNAVRNLIRDKKVHQLDAVIASGQAEGMASMDAGLVSLFREGKITAQTAVAYTQNPESM